MFKNRKGFSALGLGIVIAAVILVVAAIVIMSFFGGGVNTIKLFFEKGITQISEDCDGDGIPGVGGGESTDRCPCITKGETPDSDHVGCPEGLSEAQRKRDRVTCNQFVLNEENKQYSNECTWEEESGDCKRRCELVRAEITGEDLEQQIKKGREGDWDLVVKSLKVIHGEDSRNIVISGKETEWVFDLENKNKVFELNTKFSVQNKKQQKIVDPIHASFEVCDKQRKNCMVKKEIKLDLSGNDFSPNVLIGSDNDPCDTDKDTACYVRLRVDSERAIYEGIAGEKNNDVWFYVVLNNRNFEPYKFRNFQVVARTDDGTDGGMLDYYIEKEENNDGISYSYGEDIEDFFLNLIKRPVQDKGCWVIAEEDEGWLDSYFGAVALPNGYTISYNHNKKFLKSVSYGDKEAYDEVLKYSWKALTDSDLSGSIICYDGEWSLCDNDANTEWLDIENKRYQCKSGNWIESIK